MKFSFLKFGVILIFSLTYVQSASYSDCEVYGNCNVNPTVSSEPVNYSAVNVNNSQYLQGLTPQQVADLYSETDPIYSANTYAVAMDQNVDTTASPSFQRVITTGDSGYYSGIDMNGYDALGNYDSGGLSWFLGYNQGGNRQMWMGDPASLGNPADSFFRYMIIWGVPMVDGVTGDGSSNMPIAIGMWSPVYFGDYQDDFTGAMQQMTTISSNGIYRKSDASLIANIDSAQWNGYASNAYSADYATSAGWATQLYDGSNVLSIDGNRALYDTDGSTTVTTWGQSDGGLQIYNTISEPNGYWSITNSGVATFDGGNIYSDGSGDLTISNYLSVPTIVYNFDPTTYSSIDVFNGMLMAPNSYYSVDYANFQLKNGYAGMTTDVVMNWAYGGNPNGILITAPIPFADLGADNDPIIIMGVAGSDNTGYAGTGYRGTDLKFYAGDGGDATDATEGYGGSGGGIEFNLGSVGVSDSGYSVNLPGDLVFNAGVDGISGAKSYANFNGFERIELGASQVFLSGQTIASQAYFTTYGGYNTADGGVPFISAGKHLSNQGADISQTSLIQTGGFFKINYYLQTTTANVTAGTVTLNITWTDDVGVTNQLSTPLSLNTTGRTSGVIPIRLGGSNHIYYSTLHTGNYNTAKYRLDLEMERYT